MTVWSIFRCAALSAAFLLGTTAGAAAVKEVPSTGQTAPASKESLIQDLKSEDLATKRKAIYALGNTKSTDAIDPLLQLLKNPEENAAIKREAVAALGRIGGDKAYQTLVSVLQNKDEPKEIRAKAVQALAQFDRPDVVSIFIPVLKSTDEKILQTQLIQALGQFDSPQAIDALLTILRPDAKGQQQVGAIMALGRLRAESAVGPLLQLLKSDSTPNIQRAIVGALALIDDSKAAGPLATLLGKTEDSRLQVEIIKALAKFRDPATAGAIIPLLKSGDTSVQSYAVYTLGEMGDSAAAQPLVDLFNSLTDPGELAANFKGQNRTLMTNIQIRTLIARSIRNVFPVKGISVFKEMTMPIDVSDSGRFKDTLEQAFITVRLEGLQGLAETQDASVAPFLLQQGLLEDPSFRIRAVVARILGEMGDQAAAPALSNILRSDQAPQVRWAAAWALGQLGDQQSVTQLIGALKDKHPEVVIQAIHSLARFGTKPAMQAIESVKSTSQSQEVQQVADAALKGGSSTTQTQFKASLPRQTSP